MTIRSDIQAANAKVGDNADYLSTNSLTKAKLLVEGLQTLLALRASAQEKGGSTAESIRFDQLALRSLLADVKKWIAVNTPRTNGTTRLRMRCYRD
jgi:hypothetical protein